MKKRIISGIIAFMISFNLLPMVFAGTAVLKVDSFELNPDTQVVTITGTVEQAEPHQQVTLRVFDSEDQINYVTQTPVGETGEFSVTYKMTGASGSYKAYVNTNGIEKAYEKAFEFIDINEIAEVIRQINQAQDAASLYTLLCDAHTQKCLGIDLKEYEEIGSVSGACVLMKKNHLSFETAVQVVEALKLYTVLAGINGTESADKVGALIEKYTQMLGVDQLVRYAVYAKDETVREGTNKRLMSYDYANIKELGETFEEQTVLEQIAVLKGYGDIVEIIDKNNDILNLSLTTYNSLKKKSVVQQAVAGVSYKSAEEFKRAFDKAVQDEYNNENKGSSTHGGSGGGSSLRVPAVSTSTPAPSSSPSPEGNQPQTNSFSDIETVPWAVDGINAMHELGIINGDGSGRFYPERDVTREEFVKMLVMVLGFENRESTKQSFSDVDSAQWYSVYVYTAAENGLISGYPDGTFGIGKPISREDMAVIIQRALQAIGKTLKQELEEKAFTDKDDIAEYAAESVRYMQTAGIVNGYEDGSFAPKTSVTRAAAAKILYSVYDAIQ